MAAFATSGGGLILIGVRDDGSVTGLIEADRDKHYHRAQAIASQVQPRVDCRVSLCFDEGFIVVICVHDKQSEPVYYYEQRAYIRDGRASRPATPDEVKNAVWSHSSSEHKRKMEELKYQMAKNAVELSAQRTARADEFAIDQADTLSQIGRDFANRNR